MILIAIIMTAITVILIVGQPHSHGGAYVNRAMVMIILWTLVYAVAVHGFGFAPISEWIK